MDTEPEQKLCESFCVYKRLKFSPSKGTGGILMHRHCRREGWICAAFAACLLVVSAGCGGSSSTTSSGVITVVISPTAATIPVNTSQQFVASVSNAKDTSVTWQVNGTAGGSATYGTVSSTGTYTAPSAVPSGSITVTAVANADTSKTATAAVTVTNANKLTVTPAQATVAAGGQQTFSVALGTSSIDAAWSLSCQSNVSGACGTISSGGVYTAPLSPPPGQLVSITASSKNNTANPAYAPVTVTFGNGTIGNGSSPAQYSFELTGRSGGQPFTEAGSITFDGKGAITGGIEDRGGATPIMITGGSYVADAQGRVSATIHTDTGGDEGWQITLVNHSHAVVMRVDSVIARGNLDLQNSAQFGQPLSGNFSFHLEKRTTAPIPFSAIVGSLTLDSNGAVTAGALDSNNGGGVTSSPSVSGSSTAPDANGRGTLTLSSGLGTQMFAYYVVSSTAAKLIEIDGASGLAGGIAGRSPSAVTVDQLAGNYAFVFHGATSSGALGQGGTFSADANGNVSVSSFDTSTDTGAQLGNFFSATFSTPDSATGRTEVTFPAGGSTLRYVLYPASLTHQILFLEIDGSSVTTGMATRQGGIVNGTTAPSVSGQFAILAGETSGSLQRTITGFFTPASVSTGALDINDAGNVTLGDVLQSSSFSVTSQYGRGKIQLQTGSLPATGYTTYLVDSSTVLILETDRKGVVTGEMQNQY
jgi:hypothetical protein